MKEGERSRQADTERERERDRAISRCICLMRQMKSVCLGGALAAGKTSVQLAFSLVSSLSLLLCLFDANQPIYPRMHVYVPQPGSGEMLQTVFDTFVFRESDLLPEFSAQHLISGEMISRVD